MTTPTRYAADYIADIDDMTENPADTKYHTVCGSDVEQVKARACALDINGECYFIRLEEWVELCPGDGVYDWRVIETYRL